MRSEEWAAPFDPAVLGLDCQPGHALERRPGGTGVALVVRCRPGQPAQPKLVLGAVAEFSIDCSQLHNDSTSVKLTGVYAGATGLARGAKATLAAKRGHSKDHRPDLKQLVFILTVTADGAVPVACRTTDANVEDSTTHVATWDALVALLGRTDFLYVADSKLATRDNMAHIVKHHGRFVSVLPASRKEDSTFRLYLVDHEPTWTEALRRTRRLDEPDDIYETTEAPWPSAEGYRVAWVRSSAKYDRDAESRQNRIATGIFAIDLLNQKLASPKTRMKTVVAIETERIAEMPAPAELAEIGVQVDSVVQAGLQAGSVGVDSDGNGSSVHRRPANVPNGDDGVARLGGSGADWPRTTYPSPTGAARCNSAIKSRCGGGGHGPTGRELGGDELGAVQIGHGGAGLGAQEQRPQVVPRGQVGAPPTEKTSSKPSATAHISRAAEPRARNWAQPRCRRG
jgi:hypothetical protein